MLIFFWISLRIFSFLKLSIRPSFLVKWIFSEYKKAILLLCFPSSRINPKQNKKPSKLSETLKIQIFCLYFYVQTFKRRSNFNSSKTFIFHLKIHNKKFNQNQTTRYYIKFWKLKKYTFQILIKITLFVFLQQ